MQLFLIRHGESENNVLFRQNGGTTGRVSEPRLTELGAHQANLLAEHVARPFTPPDELNMNGYGLTHLYSSLMVRAVQTATAVAQATKLPLHAWELVHEGGGIFEHDEETGTYTGLPGENRRFYETHFPHLILPETVGEEGWWNRPYETRPQMMARVETFLEELLARHGRTEDKVAIVSHGGFINGVLRTIFGVYDGDEAVNWSVWYKINNTAITRIDFNDGNVSLAYHNRTCHLSAAELSY